MRPDSRWRWLLALLPGPLAWFVFRPRDRFVQPSAALSVVGWVRTIIGFIIVLSVAVAIQGKDQPEITNDAVVKAEIGAGLAVPASCS